MKSLQQGTAPCLQPHLKSFSNNPDLHLGGDVDFHQERRYHLEVFGFHKLPKEKQAPIGKVEFTAVRGPHGSILIRLFYTRSSVASLRPVALSTCGFDPLRSVGVEYGHKIQEDGVDIKWHHCPDLTHGFLQMAPWSEEALKAKNDVGEELERLAYGS